MFNQNPIISHLVPDNQRMDVADRIFGMGYALQLEPLVFRMAEALADDYDGSYWDFYPIKRWVLHGPNGAATLHGAL